MCADDREVPMPSGCLKREESNRYRSPLEDSDWQTILHTVKNGLSLLEGTEIRLLAEAIAQRMRWLGIFMSHYCSLTCPQCEDPCCHGKDVFYNRADLLYLCSLGSFMPPGQTRTRSSEPCRYLGSNGCILPRVARPYVCVWFVCDAQMEIFQEENPSFQRHVIKAMQEIRTSRLKLESLFELAVPNA